jgi:hypothetical protein
MPVIASTVITIITINSIISIVTIQVKFAVIPYPSKKLSLETAEQSFYGQV